MLFVNMFLELLLMECEECMNKQQWACSVFWSLMVMVYFQYSNPRVSDCFYNSHYDGNIPEVQLQIDRTFLPLFLDLWHGWQWWLLPKSGDEINHEISLGELQDSF